MSKHNYNQYSKNRGNTNGGNSGLDAKASIKPNNQNQPNNQQKKPGPIEHKEVEVKPEVKMVQETVETVSLPETVEGTVVNCAKLNVRSEPDPTAEVICILDVMSEIEINVAKSTDEWFHVCTATGVEGYCMRKFIEAYL